MKTTSRKRLLISSVAMLLVAMLALGTATFIWFSTSTTAKANNFKVKTIQASNLLSERVQTVQKIAQTGQHRLITIVTVFRHLSLHQLKILIHGLMH